VNVAIAVYCFGAWRTRAALAGVTAMEAMGDAETVRDAGGLTMEPSVAVIEVVPPAIPAAVPWIPGELLIVAMDGLEDAQVTVEVITLVLLSA
jgi:S1-C subfamily serine protease